MNQNEKGFKSGFISLVGRPNVGKSTLMNCLIGEKLAIISQKPQTTRNKIQGILTRPGFQAVFIDTPGIHKPKTKLGEAMVRSAKSALSEIDAVLFLISAKDGVTDDDKMVLENLKKVDSPVFLVINKIDTVDKPVLLTLIDACATLLEFAGVVPVSAKNSENTDSLLSAIEDVLPEGPRYFPDDMITDQPERFIAAEIIREKALELLQDEIPHGVAVEIISLKKRENRNLIDIEATIYCERESHKGIIIGKNGAMLQPIGTRARQDMERLFSSPINLQLWVKVKKDWRDNDFLVKNIGGAGLDK